MKITDKELFEIVDAALRHSEQRLANRASETAIRRVLEHLQSIGVIDTHGRSLVQYRYINAECYPPLVMS